MKKIIALMSSKWANLKEALKQHKFSKITMLLLGTLILATVCTYKINTDNELAASTSKQNTQKGIILDLFDEQYTTAVSVYKHPVPDSLGVTTRECKLIHLRVWAKGDSISLTNFVTQDTLIAGKVIGIAPNNATVVCETHNGLRFSFTKYRPEDQDPADPTALTLMFHLANDNMPFVFLSKKTKCEDLEKLLHLLN